MTSKRYRYLLFFSFILTGNKMGGMKNNKNGNKEKNS